MKYALLALFCLACRGSLETAPDPDLPTSVPSVLGPVPIFYVDTIRAVDSTKMLVGGYDYYARRILIRQEARRSAITARSIAWHEWCHVVLVDAGLFVEPSLLEVLCNVLAQARTAERPPRR
jgi:hypothetical protein